MRKVNLINVDEETQFYYHQADISSEAVGLVENCETGKFHLVSLPDIVFIAPPNDIDKYEKIADALSDYKLANGGFDIDFSDTRAIVACFQDIVEIHLGND